MRVLFDGEVLHAWLPAGCFTLRRDGAVEWHTPDSPQRDPASRMNDEVRLPRSVDAEVLAAFGDGVLDAAVPVSGLCALSIDEV